MMKNNISNFHIRRLNELVGAQFPGILLLNLTDDLKLLKCLSFF